MKHLSASKTGARGKTFGLLRIPVLAFLALMIGIGAAGAEEAGTLRVAMTGQYWPLHGEKEGERVGFEVDVAFLIGKQLGKQVVFLSRADLGTGTLQAVAEGKADMGLSAITPTAERRKIVDFSRPICAVRYLVVHDGGTNPCEKEVYAARGPAYEAAKKALGSMAKPVQDDTTAIRMVQEGKARCAVVEEPAIANYTGKSEAVKVLKTLVGESPIAIAVPKGKKREIDVLLDDAKVFRYVEESQRTWNVRRSFTSEEAVILPYAEWPAEIRAVSASASEAGDKRALQSSPKGGSGTRGAKGFLKENMKAPASEGDQWYCAEVVRNIPLFEAPDPKAQRIGNVGICYRRDVSASYVMRIDDVRGRVAEFKDQDFWCIGYQDGICNPRWYEQKNGYILIKASGHWAWVRAREIADYLVAQTWAQEFAEADPSQLMYWQGVQVHEKPAAASKRLLTLQEGKHLIRRFTGRQSGSWLEAEVWELPDEGGGEFLSSYELERLPIFRTSVKHTGWIKVLTDRGEPAGLYINYSGM